MPLPGVNQDKLAKHWQGAGGTAEQAAELYAMFTGGDLGQSTLFGLGIMPYISASIILQLLVTVVPSLEKLAKEGERRATKDQRVHALRHGGAMSGTGDVLGPLPQLKRIGLSPIFRTA